MMHKTTPEFWDRLDELPVSVQTLARKNFELLEEDPTHPSLHFKKVGRYWSAKVGLGYRVLGIKDENDFIWVWIGKHDEYVRMIG